MPGWTYATISRHPNIEDGIDELARMGHPALETSLGFQSHREPAPHVKPARSRRLTHRATHWRSDEPSWRASGPRSQTEAAGHHPLGTERRLAPIPTGCLVMRVDAMLTRAGGEVRT